MTRSKGPTAIGWLGLGLSVLAPSLTVAWFFVLLDDYGYHEGGSVTLGVLGIVAVAAYIAAILFDSLAGLRGRANRVAGIVGGGVLLILPVLEVGFALFGVN